MWVGLSGGDGAEVEFAAGQVDHGAEVAHVLESAGSGLDVLDDAVESFEDRVGVGVVEVGEDVPPVAAYLAGELFHGFESGARHPRAQTLEGRLGLGSIGAGVVDVLEGLAHLTGASGFQSSPLQAALGFQLQAGQVRFVPQPQVLGPLEQRVAAGLLFADLVDGLVGVFDHVELVDDSRRVGQPLADALGEPQAHVAGNQTHPVGIAVVVHEIPREPFDRGRVLARDHADYVALHQVGDHGDVPVALPAGLVDAYGLHARVVLVKPRLVHVMADEPPQAGVMFADLLGDVRDRLAFGQLHDHRLEQEREPASRPRPRHRDRVHAVGGARHARHARVNERLVLEEVQMPPHALPRVMHRTRGLAAPRFRAGEPRTRREPDRDMQFPSAVLLVAELHARHPPRVRQLQGGGEQRRGIHTPKLPDQHHHPPPHSPTPNSERPDLFTVPLPPQSISMRYGEPRVVQALQSGNAQYLGSLVVGDEIEMDFSSLDVDGQIGEYLQFFSQFSGGNLAWKHWVVDGFFNQTQLRIRPRYLAAEGLAKAFSDDVVPDGVQKIVTKQGWLPPVNTASKTAVRIVRRNAFGEPRLSSAHHMPCSWQWRHE